MKLYQAMAKAAGAYHRCVASNNTDWQQKWNDSLKQWTEDYFPRGSGFDRGTKLDLDVSGDDMLVFTTAFHHMNESGMYDGWTEHTVKIRPSLALGYHVHVTGPNRNDIKSYIAEQFSYALEQDEICETQTV